MKTYSLLFIFYFFFQTTILEGQALPSNHLNQGHIQGIESLFKTFQEELLNYLQNFSKNAISILKPEDTLDIHADLEYSLPRIYIASILANSQQSHFQIFFEYYRQQQEHFKISDRNSLQCFHFLWILSQQYQSAIGAPYFVPIVEKKNGIIQRRFLFSFNEFKNKLAKPLCPKTSYELIEPFEPQNISSYLKKLQIKTPTHSSECINLFSKLTQNALAFPLCSAYQASQIKDSSIESISLLGDKNQLKSTQERIKEWLRKRKNDYSKKLNSQEIFILKNLCENIHSSTLFCQAYSGLSQWEQMATKQIPGDTLQLFCQAKYKKNECQTNELLEVAKFLHEQPQACLGLLQGKSPSLYPSLTCSQILYLSTQSSFNLDKIDCPGILGHEGFLNFVRILNYFNFETSKIKMSANLNNQLSCIALPFMTNILIQDFNHNPIFSLPKMTYVDQVLNEKRVQNFIPGVGKEWNQDNYLPPKDLSPHGEAEIVSRIIQRNYALPKLPLCQFVNEDDFNLDRLDFQNDCFIVFNIFNCRDSFCPRKIYFRGKQLENITIEGDMYFEYFSTNYKMNKFSLSQLLTDHFQLESTTLTNLSQIHAHFHFSGKKMIHGVACAEDLLYQIRPTFFLNQCEPMAFIISQKLHNTTSRQDDIFIIHYSWDHPQSPRTISWTRLSSSLKRFQYLHPLKIFPLIGLKEKNVSTAK